MTAPGAPDRGIDFDVARLTVIVFPPQDGHTINIGGLAPCT